MRTACSRLAAVVWLLTAALVGSSSDDLQAADRREAQTRREPQAAADAGRIEEVLDRFCALDHSRDQTEVWCAAMKELVECGPEAVPQICRKLDETGENHVIRGLGFALRAIGDPRAVPALIRTIPKTLVPPCSDYGMTVDDAELARFMQEHDLSPGESKEGSTDFKFGRPVREVFGALHKITGQNFGAAELNFVHRSEDPRRQILQRRIFERHAQQWAAWWNEHAGEFTNDPAAAKVKLEFADEELPPSTDVLRTESRIVDGRSGAVLSPAVEQGVYAKHFLDLDTGCQANWPAEIPQDEARLDSEKLAAWAEANGVDVMCVTHKSPTGKETWELRTFGLLAWEIDPDKADKLADLVRSQTIFDLPAAPGRLMHFDPASQQDVADAPAAFVYQTRDGNWGLLKITDRIIRAEDITGRAETPKGVGFHLGVRFSWNAIIP